MDGIINLSKRLLAAASLVSENGTLADIGTDHAFVPVYLYQKKKISSAIAMDIGRGPLLRAKENIASAGLSDFIETRLSDGAAALAVGEADSILIAGMGGGVMMHILEDGRSVFRAAKEIVLQPQSKLKEVRIYLSRHGFAVRNEDMVYEDGKFYPMMRIQYDPSFKSVQNELFYLYGEQLLLSRNPVLYRYLQKEKSVHEEILDRLKRQGSGERIAERKRQIEQILYDNKCAMHYYEETGVKERQTDRSPTQK